MAHNTWLSRLLYSDGLFLLAFALAHVCTATGYMRFLRRAGLWRMKFFVSAGLLAVLTGALLFSGIERRSIWADEDQQAFSSGRCELPQFRSPSCLVDAAADAQHPPGAYVYQMVSLKLLGLTPRGARAPSAVMGIFSALFFFTLLLLVSPAYGLAFVGAGELMLHPFAFFYAREGRPHIFALGYSLLVLLATYDFLSGPRGRRAGAWLIACLLLFLWTCGLQPPVYAAVLFFCAAIGARLAGPAFRSRIPAFFGCGLAALLGLLPYLYYSVVTTRKFGWTKAVDFNAWRSGEEIANVWAVAEQLLGAHAWVYGLGLGLAIAAAFSARARAFARPLLFFSALAVAFYLSERILFSSFFAHNFFGRYAIAAVPCLLAAAYCVCLAAGAPWGGIRGRALSFALLVLLAWANWSSPHTQAAVDEPKVDWSGLYVGISRNSEKFDRAIFLSLDVYRIDAGAFFSSRFYYRGPAELCDAFWDGCPSLEAQLKEALASRGSLLLAIDTAKSAAAREFLSSPAGQSPVVAASDTYALLKFPAGAPGKLRSFLTALADALGSDPVTTRLRSLAALVHGDARRH